MNKQGSHKIDYLDYIWNPVKGLCKYNCEYCFMQRYYKRFNLNPEIRFDETELNTRFLNIPSKMGVCFNHDLFGEWIPSEWIYRIIKRTEENPQHIFIFLTKNPKRYNEFKFPKNCWLGTTVDGTPRTIGNLELLARIEHQNLKFISFEPLLAIIYLRSIPTAIYSKFGWFIIGADSNPGAIHPPLIWADMFRKLCIQLGKPLWIKDNFKFPIKVKEWPYQKNN